MKYIVFIFIAVLTACAAPKSVSTNAPKEETLRGDFQNMMGVMQPVSCYCYESGYLQTATERVALCFAPNTTVPPSGTITVTGKFTEREHKGGATDPCPSGKMTVFEVIRFTK